MRIRNKNKIAIYFEFRLIYTTFASDYEERTRFGRWSHAWLVDCRCD